MNAETQTHTPGRLAPINPPLQLAWCQRGVMKIDLDTHGVCADTVGE
jgi:hypothetical protein